MALFAQGCLCKTSCRKNIYSRYFWNISFYLCPFHMINIHGKQCIWRTKIEINLHLFFRDRKNCLFLGPTKSEKKSFLCVYHVTTRFSILLWQTKKDLASNYMDLQDNQNCDLFGKYKWYFSDRHNRNRLQLTQVKMSSARMNPGDWTTITTHYWAIVTFI